jgi:hypothetical protein
MGTSNTPIILILFLLNFSNLPDPSDSVESTPLENDFEAIEDAVQKLARPDFIEIPHLIQEVNVGGGYTTYNWAEDVEGITEAQRKSVALKRHSVDHHVKTGIIY